MDKSPKYTGYRWNETHTRVLVYIRGTEVAYFDDAGCHMLDRIDMTRS